MMTTNDYIIITIIIKVYHQKISIRKGLHSLYRTEEVLDGSQLSNDIWLYGSFVQYHWQDALHGANSW